ncbi:MAG TPA: ABC-F family ATP-binding cassette domain-containing protein [Blastocatellia bacterium]
MGEPASIDEIALPEELSSSGAISLIMLLRLEEVRKSYGASDVLRGVTFQVNPGEHAGIVGANGAGKTTIFGLISGCEEPDAGQLSTARGLKIGVLPQQPSFDGLLSVREQALSVFHHLHSLEAKMASLEHLMAEATGPELEQVMATYSDARHAYEHDGGFVYTARAEAVLAGLGFGEAEFDSPAGTLSGGQKARLALAKLLLEAPDLLLLDEPTNHLDLTAIRWLEEFLSSYKPAFVIISHDRLLLDRVAGKIIEIAKGKATVYNGNYSAYVKQREEQRLAQGRVYEEQQELIKRTEEFIRRNLAGQKTKQAKSRRNMLERMERIEIDPLDSTTNFSLGEPGQKKKRAAETHRSGSTALTVRDLAIGYNSRPVASGISFILQPGERLGITGPNGAGKTTLLRTLIGQMQPIAGTIEWAANVRLAYYDQELSSLDPESTPLQMLGLTRPAGVSGAAAIKSEGELRNFLGRFLFSGDDVFKQISAMSGGEKSRLALARLIFSQPTVLALDEPTNHLDIRSREALETALAEFSGTIITISHDRYFLDKITTEILNIDGGAAVHRLGNYSEFEEASRPLPIEPEVLTRPRPAQKAQSAKAGAKNDRRTGIRGPELVETEIAQLEQELSTLAEKLSKPESGWELDHIAEMGSRHTEISSRLEALYQEWEEISSISPP